MANYKKSFNFRSGVQVDTDNFVVNANGLVGIGTSIPGRVLDVYGTIRTSGLVTSQQLYVTGISTFDSDVDLNNGTLLVGNNIKLDANSGVITATAINIGERTVTNLVGYSTEAWIIDPVINGISTTFNVAIGTMVSAQYDLLIGRDPIAGSNPGPGISFVGSSGDIVSTGVITATTFSGNLSATDLTGIIPNDRFAGIITATLQGNVIGIATTARGLTGSPNIEVGVTTASRVVSTSSSVGFATVTDTLNVRGKVGIGTTLPEADLEISKTFAKLSIISPDASLARISIGNSEHVSTASSLSLIEYQHNNLSIKNKSYGDFGLVLHSGEVTPGISTGSFKWGYKNTTTPLMTLTHEGDLGLGVSPTERFHVSGASKFGGNVTFDSGYTFSINSQTLSVSETTTTTFSGAVNLNGQVSIGATVGFDTSNYPELNVPLYPTTFLTGINTTQGSVIFDDTTKKLKFWNGTAWETITSST